MADLARAVRATDPPSRQRPHDRQGIPQGMDLPRCPQHRAASAGGAVRADSESFKRSPLTERERELLLVLHELQPCTLRDLADRLGLRSSATVYMRLCRLRWFGIVN